MTTTSVVGACLQIASARLQVTTAVRWQWKGNANAFAARGSRRLRALRSTIEDVVDRLRARKLGRTWRVQLAERWQVPLELQPAGLLPA